ncbi:Lysine-specific demethylase 4B [Mactra antiquata]
MKSVWAKDGTSNVHRSSTERHNSSDVHKEASRLSVKSKSCVYVLDIADDELSRTPVSDHDVFLIRTVYMTMKEELSLDKECTLCTLRGGALKPTTYGKWAHVICSLSLKEVKFDNVQRREPINTSKISPARMKLKCQYCCGSLYDSKFLSRACVQCSNGRCTLSFHVTCAHAAGVVFETSDWPHPVYITCSRHMHLTKNKVCID